MRRMLDEREWAASVGMVDAIRARIGTCNPEEMDEFARALEFAQSDEQGAELKGVGK